MLLSTASRSTATVISDVRWGLGSALPLAVLMGAVAAVFRLIIGPTYAPGVSLFGLLLDYGLLGFSAGILLGIFRPLTHSMRGAAIIGGVWGIFLDLVIMVPFGRWAPFDAVFMLIYTIGGAGLGAQIWRVSQRIKAKRRAGLL